MGSIRRRLSGLIEDFVPGEAKRGPPDELRRARLAVVMAFLMTLVFLVLGTAHWISGSPLEAALNFALSFLMALGVGAFRFTGRFRPVFHAVLAVTFVFILCLCLFTRGGGTNPATVALAEVPLFATIIGGIRLGVFWLGLSLIGSILIGVLAMEGIIVDRMPPEMKLFDDHVSLVLITGTLFIVATLYEVWTRQSLLHIEHLEAKRRRAERETIEAMSEVRVAQAERLASMGRIAAATAHEINNPLTVVMASLDHFHRHLPPHRAEEWQSIVDSAVEGAERIRRIVREMRGFARVDESQVGPVDVRAAVAIAAKMAEGSVRPRARLQMDLPDLPPVSAHESQLVQVFLNLILNAAEAIPEGNADEHVITIAGKVEGERVQVEVVDTGTGMSREDLRRAFEPFYTTKPVGEGMGLGLALCHTIVQRYRGTLELESRPGRTVARVTLKIHPQGAAAAAPIVEPEPALEIDPLDILIVDDETSVANSLRLLMAPHRVTIANDGFQALDFLDKAEFDLVLCDVMMPRMTGIDVYERLYATNPAIAKKMVFMSGGIFTRRANEFRSRVSNTFLDKPILRRELRPVLEACARAKLSSAS